MKPNLQELNSREIYADAALQLIDILIEFLAQTASFKLSQSTMLMELDLRRLVVDGVLRNEILSDHFSIDRDLWRHPSHTSRGCWRFLGGMNTTVNCHSFSHVSQLSSLEKNLQVEGFLSARNSAGPALCVVFCSAV